jgi:hypothetical protein
MRCEEHVQIVTVGRTNFWLLLYGCLIYVISHRNICPRVEGCGCSAYQEILNSSKCLPEIFSAFATAYDEIDFEHIKEKEDWVSLVSSDSSICGSKGLMEIFEHSACIAWFQAIRTRVFPF